MNSTYAQPLDALVCRSRLVIGDDICYSLITVS